jgi:hypothetical protein
MKSFFKVFSLLVVVFGIMVFTSCKKDDDESNDINMTKDNVVGTWTNTSKNIILTISSNGTGVYSSPYYSNPPEAITWAISGEKTLHLQGTGLFTQNYQLKSSTKLKETSLDIELTKQ